MLKEGFSFKGQPDTNIARVMIFKKYFSTVDFTY